MSPDPRVVTLLPSATEIVAALGVEPVGISHECDYPPEVVGTPSVNRSRIDADASSAAINRQVVEAERAGGVYEIDVETLDDLDPDLVITQGICDVCAVDSVLVEEAVAEIAADPEILTTDPHSLADVLRDVERIGRALGREDRPRELAMGLKRRADRVGRRAAEADERPRVAVLDWTDPPMVAGHWVPEMVEIAGGEYGLADPGERSEPREWGEIREYDPEVLVVAPCGFDLEQTRENLSDLTDREVWADLTAVREDRAVAVDGNAYLNRPGPRLVDSLEHLAGVIHPDRFESPPADAVRPLTDLARTGSADQEPG
ncbi:cobalamin-binding protein [Halobacteriales archaeon QS_8_69_26]|nr:MAG: cobalamin-binding protein [Halobacteriales archaeon QS_8_69_26]